MKKVLITLVIILVAASCGSKQPEEKVADAPATHLEQFVDSMKAVYPNYKGNIAVGKKMSEALENRLAVLPGVLDDAQFYIVGIGEIAGSFNVMLSYEGSKDINLLIWCANFGKDKAAKLDKTKLYRVTSGTLVSTDHDTMPIPSKVELGQFTFKDLEVEEIPGSHFESPIPL